MDEKALSTLTPEQTSVIPAIVQQMMGPLVEAMAKLLENNTAALQQLSAAQQVQNDRLEALERQIRLNTPVTRQQVRYLSAAMKEHTLELLDKSSISDPKAVRKLAGIIKKDVLADYGITTLEEIPKHEYNVAMHNIKTWNNMRIVREVVSVKKKLRRLLWRMLNRLRVEMAYKRVPARFIKPISKTCVALWEDMT